MLVLVSLGSAPKKESGKPEPIPILPAEEAWAKQLAAPPAANAWMDDARVYVPLSRGGIVALARDTGTPVWESAIEVTRAPLGVGGALMLVVSREIRAVDPATGQLRWSQSLASDVAAPLASIEDRVILVDGNGDVTALRATDGQLEWRRSLGASTRYAPATVESRAIVLTLTDGRVAALDGRTGEVTWERSLPGTLSAPAIARDRVLVGSTNNFFYALDAESGSERWRWRTGADVVGAAASGDRVFFISLDNILRAVNRDNGNQLWKAAVASRASAPPVAFDDVVVLAGLAPRLDAFNAQTGASLGSYTPSTDLEGMPLIDTRPKPFDVATVVLLRDGRISGLRPIGLTFPDPPVVPLLKLPGRELPRDRPPSLGPSRQSVSSGRDRVRPDRREVAQATWRGTCGEAAIQVKVCGGSRKADVLEDDASQQ